MLYFSGWLIGSNAHGCKVSVAGSGLHFPRDEWEVLLCVSGSQLVIFVECLFEVLCSFLNVAFCC